MADNRCIDCGASIPPAVQRCGRCITKRLDNPPGKKRGK